MKKGIFALIAAFLVAFPFAGTAANAEAQVSDEIKKGVTSYLEEEHYDYDKGSLKVQDAETLKVDSSADKEFSQVSMMVVDFSTVRDNIFFENHTQVLFYDTESNAVIPDAQVLDLEKAKEFKDSHETGQHLHMGVILFLSAIMFVVPFLIAYMWSKNKYSTLSFKLKNNVYETNSTF
ncbi:hypothetical protein [Pseudalkalibacillus hwajinpoensis]|uniref:Uncharacterized protein n=1 Tax=Guptibacillus hwajinpoensis TaxID=208199 RepID=A0A4U1MB24_9BACL|nr:hypothetical protein [Pseudalkalibacillus hwajinpoensis]TKD67977.1 hypothetical protein FBF83_18185 [Pseudalkalibacillus hwajinpoensis]